MDSAAAALKSEIWGDLYSVYRWLFDDPSVPSHRYMFQNLDGNSFRRPSCLVKLVRARNKPHNIVSRSADLDIMVQYYATNHWEAVGVGDRILNAFSGWPQVILPKYDFSKSPPERISITGVDQYGVAVPSTMGIRIDPESVGMDIVTTEDQKYQVAVTFTMVSPRQRAQTLAPFLTEATITLITNALITPIDVDISMKSSLTCTVE